MTALQLLRRKLQQHLRDWIEIPSESEQEEQKREFQKRLFQLQIECEEWRQAFRSTFQMCSTLTIKDTVGDLVKEKIRTVHKWEDWKESQISAITQKELVGTEFYQNKIKKLSNDAKTTL